ncbi:hypothetical protein V6N13_014717 [Hibiscus sabdariffa]
MVSVCWYLAWMDLELISIITVQVGIVRVPCFCHWITLTRCKDILGTQVEEPFHILDQASVQQIIDVFEIVGELLSLMLLPAKVWPLWIFEDGRTSVSSF